MATSFFKRRSTAAASDLKKLTQTETELAQSSFNIEKITDIQNRFTGGEVLLVPGRIFIREGILWKVCRKGPKKRQFFLFNDVLIYGSIISRGYYSNQHILPMSSMTVSAECHYMPQVELEEKERENNSSELNSENAFQINHADKSFHVYAQSKADKTNWISNLTKQINRLSNGGDNDKVLHKAVWVPDSASKQCMICKQKFTAFVRKHHCRMCGRVVCSQCSPEKADIAQLSGVTPSGKLERICSQCKKPLIVSSFNDSTSKIEKNHQEEVVGVSKPKTSTTKDEDSTETEDSDDSTNEDPPIPPPRRKKLTKLEDSPVIQKTRVILERSKSEEKKNPPPRPQPPKISPLKSSTKEGKLGGPPPRPTSPPKQSPSHERKEEGETSLAQPLTTKQPSEMRSETDKGISQPVAPKRSPKRIEDRESPAQSVTSNRSSEKKPEEGEEISQPVPPKRSSRNNTNRENNGGPSTQPVVPKLSSEGADEGVSQPVPPKRSSRNNTNKENNGGPSTQPVAPKLSSEGADEGVSQPVPPKRSSRNNTNKENNGGSSTQPVVPKLSSEGADERVSQPVVLKQSSEGADERTTQPTVPKRSLSNSKPISGELPVQPQSPLTDTKIEDKNKSPTHPIVPKQTLPASEGTKEEQSADQTVPQDKEDEMVVTKDLVNEDNTNKLVDTMDDSKQENKKSPQSSIHRKKKYISSPSETVSEDLQPTKKSQTTEENSEPNQQALLPQDSPIAGRSPSTNARPRKSKFAVPNCS